jgi:hypothetical protein
VVFRWLQGKCFSWISDELSFIDYSTTHRANPIRFMLFHVGGTAARTGWGMGVGRTSFFCFHVQKISGKCKGIEIWGICKGCCCITRKELLFLEE